MERTPLAAARGGTPPQKLSCCSSLLQYRSQPDRCDAPDANLSDVTFFDKADDTAGRGLKRDMTDIFALAGGVATTIFEHEVSWVKVILLADREFRRSVSGDPHARTTLRARSRSANMPLSHINDELLEQFDLSPCVLPDPPRTLAFPLRPRALAPVRLDCF